MSPSPDQEIASASREIEEQSDGVLGWQLSRPIPVQPKRRLLAKESHRGKSYSGPVEPG